LIISTRSIVTRGLDPQVHSLCKKMDCRVKPGNDSEGIDPAGISSGLQPEWLGG
jgi:hypothetical protein